MNIIIQQSIRQPSSIGLNFLLNSPSLVLLCHTKLSSIQIQQSLDPLITWLPETMAYIVPKFWNGKVKQQLNQQKKLNPIDLSSCQKVLKCKSLIYRYLFIVFTCRRLRCFIIGMLFVQFTFSGTLFLMLFSWYSIIACGETQSSRKFETTLNLRQQVSCHLYFFERNCKVSNFWRMSLIKALGNIKLLIKSKLINIESDFIDIDFASSRGWLDFPPFFLSVYGAS